MKQASPPPSPPLSPRDEERRSSGLPPVRLPGLNGLPATVAPAPASPEAEALAGAGWPRRRHAALVVCAAAHPVAEAVDGGASRRQGVPVSAGGAGGVGGARNAHPDGERPAVGPGHPYERCSLLGRPRRRHRGLRPNSASPQRTAAVAVAVAAAGIGRAPRGSPQHFGALPAEIYRGHVGGAGHAAARRVQQPLSAHPDGCSRL